MLKETWSRYTVFTALAVLIMLASTATVQAATEEQTGEKQQLPKAAYIRGQELWMKTGEQERQLTQGEKAREPRWSADGRFIAYTSGDGTIRLYDTVADKIEQIAMKGTNYQWSPSANRLAYMDGSVLQVAGMKESGEWSFRNAALGVGNYSWQPNGRGFLVSTQAQLVPNGWTEIRLYSVPLSTGQGIPKATLLYTIPSESNGFFAVTTGHFHWSADRKWVSFIAVPTASISADSDTLLIWYWNGSQVNPIGSMLNREEWVEWSPTDSMIAFISGEGRDATVNKKLAIGWPPFGSKSILTPKGYADRDLAWLDGGSLIVSRAIESTSSGAVPYTEAAQPSLVKVSTAAGGAAVPITTPEAGCGDYSPEYNQGLRSLSWIRTNGSAASVWISEPDGSNARRWIEEIDMASTYYGQINWEDVLDRFDPKRR